jgi:hypothetical protein
MGCLKPRLDAAGGTRCKTDQEAKLSERSEFISLPVLRHVPPGTPKGQRPRGRLSFGYFLFGEAKKSN